MKGTKVNININQSNKSTENAVNRIQNSLNKLQSAINNNKTIGNKNKNININSNIRKKLIDSNDNDIKTNDIQLTETNIHDQMPIGYSMFNDTSVIKTDKRNIKINQNQGGLINNNYENIINNTTDNIPKSIQGRTNNYKKVNYISNNNNNTIQKWKCINCGNINLLYNKICINCGKPKNNQVKKESYNTNYPRSDKNNIINYINTSYEKPENDYNIGIISNQQKSNEKELKKYNTDFKFNNNQKKINNKPQSTYNVTNIMNEFNPLANSEIKKIYNNPNDINYLNLTEITDKPNYNKTNNRKLNDLYLYGDYLENELKQSNDENIKLLEEYKNIKNEVYNLAQKNKKIKQKIEELQKKDNELKTLNTQLKNGFSFVQTKFSISLNNFTKDNNENMNILKELELTNKNDIEKQKNYDEEIDNLKQKILKLTNEEEGENDDNKEEKKIKELINNIEKEKKEIEDNNDKYIFLLKDNEILNQDIDKLQKKIELNKLNGNGMKNIRDPVQRIAVLKENIQIFDKEINDNKKITNNLINEYKNLTETDIINDDNDDDNGDDNNEGDDKNEYILIKEKNDKLSGELLKLNDIIHNLSDSKDKIINIYEDEITKLNNFYLKAKEKTMINKEENDINENEAKKLIEMHEENEKIRNENYELIKDLDQLAPLQRVYQGLIEENQKLKTSLIGNELSEEKKTLLKNIISDENIIEEENNDENN